MVTIVACAVVGCLSAYIAVVAVRQLVVDRNFHPAVVPAPQVVPPAVAAEFAALGSTPAGVAGLSATAAAPTAAGVRVQLAAGMTAPALGVDPSAVVADVATGAMLFSVRAQSQIAPASTAKLLLSVALLTVDKATARFRTRVVTGSDPGTVVLVGGGDPTLTAATTESGAAYPQAAKVSTLAAQLKATGRSIGRILVDDSLFSGPETAPGWAPEDAPSEYASPITAAMIDGGRDSPLAVQRSATPDLAAGQALASALGLPAAAVSTGTAPAAAQTLAEVESAPLGRLIEEMLQSSDDVIAEVLGRQLALAAHQPPTFAGAAAAVASVLGGLGVNVGAGMSDVSGLSSLDRVTPAALAAVLALSLSPAHPGLHAILAGLPVAGWDGTLADRFTGEQAAGRGVVRAKTGSLSDQGVSTEAGTVTDIDGRQP